MISRDSELGNVIKQKAALVNLWEMRRGPILSRQIVTRDDCGMVDSIKLARISWWSHSDGLPGSLGRWSHGDRRAVLGHHLRAHRWPDLHRLLRLHHWLLWLHHGRLGLHHDALHLLLLLWVLDHHGTHRLVSQHLLLVSDLLLLLHELCLHADHFGVVVLVHSLLRVGLHGVWVLAFREHHALDAWGRRVSSVLEQHGLVVDAGLEHEVSLVLRRLLEVLLDGVLRDLVLHVDDLADVGAPHGEAERHDEVEESDVADEPPVERWDFQAALVVNATPELHLGEEEAAADEAVEAEEEAGDLLEALGQLDGLQEHEHEDCAPEEENQTSSSLQVRLSAVLVDDAEENDADKGAHQRQKDRRRPETLSCFDKLHPPFLLININNY